jgi:hypothetical protein
VKRITEQQRVAMRTRLARLKIADEPFAQRLTVKRALALRQRMESQKAREKFLENMKARFDGSESEVGEGEQRHDEVVETDQETSQSVAAQT